MIMSTSKYRCVSPQTYISSYSLTKKTEEGKQLIVGKYRTANNTYVHRSSVEMHSHKARVT
jgi:hypothetical protein